ncbi:alpha-ribazole phosphatase family protein [Flavobacterium sp. F-380]|jgi:alpha-ribazole phosphatase|uniref:Alpha-ribazole phosphatase family protein n=1 Tax=Flavobacterium kayseriense TaxID=2764714 RepID=A0ABR7J6U3_9FLAO|nr:alpha-ribazole phosphatase family protein [Flavobacterium kayseriense]MBC5841240.1 alpha-ribazole phosphatase family protein [Flavobacterium kayseriense]MBC5847768.1 alpha-ribazole phosphatase family protein [Flavobacterium kayseriense]MBU0939978.1 alpha-ribazole phosphatase family protein [Bacteroidota bacterium]
MEVYLVRHTETVCEKGVCYGQTDVGIIEPFLPVFDNIKKQLPADAIYYSSPLLRCKILANHLSSEVLIDSRLMEMNFGDWELQKWDAIPEVDLNPWMADFVTKTVPNGESFLNLHNRVLDFLSNQLLVEESKPIVIVTHSGVIRSILCQQTNTPLKDAFNSKIDFGSVTKIELSPL